VVIASIHKAVFGDNFDRVVGSGPWDVLVFDECHHLSDCNPSGGKPNQSFRLVTHLVKAQAPAGRLILMSGTPHQGSEARFRNNLRLLSNDGNDMTGAAGRVAPGRTTCLLELSTQASSKPKLLSHKLAQPEVQGGPARKCWLTAPGAK
jgi:hypothetical protein